MGQTPLGSIPQPQHGDIGHPVPVHLRITLGMFSVQHCDGLSLVGFPLTCSVTNCDRELVALICLFHCRSLLEKNIPLAVTPASWDVAAQVGSRPLDASQMPWCRPESANVAPA